PSKASSRRALRFARACVYVVSVATFHLYKNTVRAIPSCGQANRPGSGASNALTYKGASMRRTLPILILLAAAFAAFAGSHHRWDGVNCGTCVTTLVDDVTDCSDLRVIFDDRDAVRSEENVDVGAARSLIIRASEN